VATPHLDALASAGVSFRHAYANCPVCTPSRGTIMSGRHAHCGPVQSFWDVYKAAAPSLATWFNAAGYRTHSIGKWHLGVYWNQRMPSAEHVPGINNAPWARSRTPEHHRAGFQHWDAFEINNSPFKGLLYHEREDDPRIIEGFQTDVLTDVALAAIANHDDDRPLFLVLSVEPPHFPCQAPPDAARRDPQSLDLPPGSATDHPEVMAELVEYLAMIENLDANIGRLRAALDANPRFAGNTVLAYVSDHGDFAGSHGSISNKEKPHQESVRIPAVFHAPGRIAARGVDAQRLFSLVDLAPTLLGLAGIAIPRHVQGYDWSAFLAGADEPGPSEVLIEMCGVPRWDLARIDWRGFIDRRYTYCFYETGDEELFDHDADPHEQANLADTRPELLPGMRQRLRHLLAATREPYWDVLLDDPQPVPPARDVGRNTYRPERHGMSPHWRRITKVQPPWQPPG
jgi:arylsulfatase A-like enzyme